MPQRLALAPGTPIEVALRGDDVSFTPDPAGNGVIVQRLFQGAYNLYHLRLDGGQIVHAQMPHTAFYASGARVRVFISAGHPLTVFSGGEAVSQEDIS